MNHEVCLALFSFHPESFHPSAMISMIEKFELASQCIIDKIDLIMEGGSREILPGSFGLHGTGPITSLQCRTNGRLAIHLSISKGRNPSRVFIFPGRIGIFADGLRDATGYLSDEYLRFRSIYGVCGYLPDKNGVGQLDGLEQFHIDLKDFSYAFSYASRIEQIAPVMIISARHLAESPGMESTLQQIHGLSTSRLQDDSLLLIIDSGAPASSANRAIFEDLESALLPINVKQIMNAYHEKYAQSRPNRDVASLARHTKDLVPQQPIADGFASGMDNDQHTSTSKEDIEAKIHELISRTNLHHQLDVYREHVRLFEEKYLRHEKQPRNYEWRPYRFCSQDCIIGLTVICHSASHNCLEVDVCLTNDLEAYGEGSGARIMLTFLLSEAFKCGGTMEIRFSKEIEGGRVPYDLSRFAAENGIKLEHIQEARITPSESKLLFLAVSEFSEPLQQEIARLCGEGRLSLERPCFAKCNGIWSKYQIEHFIFGCANPDSILSASFLPEQRIPYLNDLRHVCAAIMGGVLDYKLAMNSREDGDTALSLEDDVKSLDVRFNGDWYAKVYSCENEEIMIPWTSASESPRIPPGTEAVVLLRAYDMPSIELNLEADIRLAFRLGQSEQEKKSRRFILLPRDFEDIPDIRMQELISVASAHDIGIMVCPDTLASLEAEGAKKLAGSRMMRK